MDVQYPLWESVWPTKGIVRIYKSLKCSSERKNNFRRKICKDLLRSKHDVHVINCLWKYGKISGNTRKERLHRTENNP